MASPTDSKLRFDGRVDDYVRARPGYPPSLVDDLAAAGALFADAVIADIGSGTGISSELFLRRGYTVIGVEPNAAMRGAAEAALGGYPRFRSHAGSAEKTGLDFSSIDLIVAAQAFHWFDTASTRAEFRRILTGEGRVALIWNARRASGTPFLAAYEELLLEFGTDYARVGHRGIGAERLAAFFAGPFATRRHANSQELDFAGLKSRLLSSSYIPAAGTAAYAAMLERLAELFSRHSVDGRVRIDYDAELYFGALPAS
jgi:SAM-dependent methyltransferase